MKQAIRPAGSYRHARHNWQHCRPETGNKHPGLKYDGPDVHRLARTDTGSPVRRLDPVTYWALRSKSGRLGIQGYIKPGITGPRPRFGGVRPAYPVPVPEPVAAKPKRVRAPRKKKAEA